MDVKKISFQQHGDARGQLVAIEEILDAPFEFKRVYFMYDTKNGVRRGYHAHRELKQILFCVHGNCKIHVDDGEKTCEYLLNKPYEGLFIEGLIWREMYDFSKDAVLMVIASDFYNENDYIRDYDKFKEAVSDLNGTD